MKVNALNVSLGFSRILVLACALAACDSADSSPPAAANDHFVVDEDNTAVIDVLLNDRVPRDTPWWIQIHDVVNGTARLVSTGTVHFTPDPDFNGEASFRYVSADDSEALVTIDVVPVNDPPTAQPGRFTTVPNRPVEVLLTGDDIDDEDSQLDYVIIDLPTHGQLDGTAPALTYNPEPDFIGDDSFSFQVRDGQSSSPVTTIDISVDPGAIPVADSQFLTIPEDHSVPVVLSASDADGDDLVLTVRSQPEFGQLTGTAPNLTYTPDANFHGNDSFTFTAFDGITVSNVATVNLHVTSENDAPIAFAQSVTTPEDLSRTIVLSGDDVDHNFLSFDIVQAPSHGALIGAGSHWTYRPAPDFFGVDHFTFTANDPHTASAPAMVTIDVEPVDDRPIAYSQTVATDEDVATAIVLQGLELDGEPLTFQVVQQPSRGTLSGVAPDLHYTPNPDANGTDIFRFVTNDGHNNSAQRTVTIDVAPVDDPPVVSDQMVTTDEDQAVALTLNAADPDGPVAMAIVSPPANGTVTGTFPSLQYTPNTDYHGTDAFTYTITESGVQASATVSISIASVNDSPRILDDVALLSAGQATTVDVLANDIDPDGDPMDIVDIGTPAHGVASLQADGSILYTPDISFTQGVDAVAYTVEDIHGAVATGTLNIGVEAFPPGSPVERLAAVETGVTPTSISGIDADSIDLSRDGRYIAFASAVDALVTGDDNGHIDIFVYDRFDAVLERVSVSTAGVQADGDSLRPRISADGELVVFRSEASNLVAGDSNAAADIFVHDRSTASTTRVSVASDGSQATGASDWPDIAADGRYVAFESAAANLVASDVNGSKDIFVHDLHSGATERVSLTSIHQEIDVGAEGPVAISADGAIVAFSSESALILAGDTNGYRDVFVRDRIAQATARISVSTTGAEGNAPSGQPTISDDGRYVAFTSWSWNLAPGGYNYLPDVFVRDRLTGETRMESVVGTNMPTYSPSMRAMISSDGRYVAISLRTAANIDLVYVRDRIGQTLKLVSATPDGQLPDDACIAAAISGDGSYIGFLSLASNLSPSATPATMSAYVAPNTL